MYENIEEILEAFFNGENSFETKDGFIWIVRHGQKRVSRQDLETVPWIKPPSFDSIEPDGIHGCINEFETLTIEPRAGGQYEVAVRIWSERAWRGYGIHGFDAAHHLVGRNTRGH